MPCNSDYLEPNQREAELQRAARLLLFVYRTLGYKGVTRDLIAAADDPYCSKDFVPDLCDVLTRERRISKVNFERFVYNGKDKNCRDLADWWDTHQEADRAREREEREQRKLKQLRNSALAKLSAAERRVLGL